MSPFATSTIQRMSGAELDRLYRRVYSRIVREFSGGLSYGVDLRTLRIVRPGLAAIVDTIARAAK